MSVESGWTVSKVSGAKDAAEVVAGGLPEITPQWAAFNLSLAADEACLICSVCFRVGIELSLLGRRRHSRESAGCGP